ncbi:hypothetical protein IWX92DRAFT_122468 [Phyllosticta citricarpa]
MYSVSDRRWSSDDDPPKSHQRRVPETDYAGESLPRMLPMLGRRNSFSTCARSFSMQEVARQRKKSGLPRPTGKASISTHCPGLVDSNASKYTRRGSLRRDGPLSLDGVEAIGRSMCSVRQVAEQRCSGPAGLAKGCREPKRERKEIRAPRIRSECRSLHLCPVGDTARPWRSCVIQPTSNGLSSYFLRLDCCKRQSRVE